jgi:hypothetical protein
MKGATLLGSKRSLCEGGRGRPLDVPKRESDQRLGVIEIERLPCEGFITFDGRISAGRRCNDTPSYTDSREAGDRSELPTS